MRESFRGRQICLGCDGICTNIVSEYRTVVPLNLHFQRVLQVRQAMNFFFSSTDHMQRSIIHVAIGARSISCGLTAGCGTVLLKTCFQLSVACQRSWLALHSEFCVGLYVPGKRQPLENLKIVCTLIWPYLSGFA